MRTHSTSAVTMIHATTVITIGAEEIYGIHTQFNQSSVCGSAPSIVN
jgi:hypothetical protein